MKEGISELTSKSMRQVAHHKPAVDMTISPDGYEPSELPQLVQEIRRLVQETPQDTRILRRRIKRRSSL